MELCIMFKEDTIIIKVDSAQVKINEQTDMPIARVVQENASLIFVNSRSSNLIKPNFSVTTINADPE